MRGLVRRGIRVRVGERIRLTQSARERAPYTEQGRVWLEPPGRPRINDCLTLIDHRPAQGFGEDGVDTTMVTDEAEDRSAFLRQLLTIVAESDIDIGPDTLENAARYARREAADPASPMARIQAELQVLKSLARDMKSALAAERKRLFDLD